jgi:hypothetical protein
MFQDLTIPTSNLQLINLYTIPKWSNNFIPYPKHFLHAQNVKFDKMLLWSHNYKDPNITQSKVRISKSNRKGSRTLPILELLLILLSTLLHLTKSLDQLFFFPLQISLPSCDCLQHESWNLCHCVHSNFLFIIQHNFQHNNWTSWPTNSTLTTLPPSFIISLNFGL